VVTITAPVIGRSCDSDSCASPVPGQVDDHVVELAPVHVLEELLQQLVHHRPAPDDGAAALDEEADRDHLHAVVDRGDDLVAGVDLPGALGVAHHLRDRRAVDVGVHDADRGSLSRQRRRQVGADGRLADAALAGRHRDDVLHAGQAGVVGAVRAPAHLGGELHVHPGDPGEPAHRFFHPTNDDLLRRAGRGGQLDGDLRAITGQLDAGDHAGADQVGLERRVLNFGQRGLDFVDGGNARSLPAFGAGR